MNPSSQTSFSENGSQDSGENGSQESSENGSQDPSETSKRTNEESLQSHNKKAKMSVNETDEKKTVADNENVMISLTKIRPQKYWSNLNLTQVFKSMICHKSSNKPDKPEKQEKTDKPVKPDQAEKNEKMSVNFELNVDEPSIQEFIVDNKKITMVKYDATKHDTIKGQGGEEKNIINIATLQFIYWKEDDNEENQDFQIYCVARYRLTNAWSKLSRWRDKQFPKKVGINLLDPSKITTAKTKNYLGINASQAEITFKKPYNDLISQQFYEKLSHWTEIKAKLHDYVHQYPNFKNDVIAKDIPWHLQAGQIKVPIRKEACNAKSIIEIILFIHKTQIENLPKPQFHKLREKLWDRLQPLKIVNFRETDEYNQDLKAELMKCLQDKDYEPSIVRYKELIKADPLPAFYNATNVRLRFGNQYIPWKPDNLTVKSADSIHLSDVIESIR